MGPLARCVADARLVFRALRGADPARPTARDPVTRRLGCPRPFFLDQLDAEVRTTFEQALDRLRTAGWDVRDAPIRHAEDTPAVCLHLLLPEAAAAHAHGLDRHADRYCPDVRLRLELGRYVLAEDHVRAQRGRAVLADAVDAALAGCDALVLPALAVPAPRLGAATVEIDGRPEPLRPLTLRLTQLFNATGHPGRLHTLRIDRRRPPLRPSARRTAEPHRPPARRRGGVRGGAVGVSRRRARHGSPPGPLPSTAFRRNAS